MSQTNVVSIGGIKYDGHSGLAIDIKPPVAAPTTKRHQPVAAKGVHTTQQRSQTLNRRFVKKTATPAAHPAQRGPVSIDMRAPVKRSPHITKFARDPHAVAAKRPSADIRPSTHPIAAKAHATHKSVAAHAAAVPAAQAPSAQDIKHAAMGKALANASTESKSSQHQPKRRAFNVAAASLGVLLITGYFTYVNMPNLSVRVAAAQAGIDASYPEYRPVGYRLNGPVAYQDGQVSMNFASNSGPLAFSLNQSKSTWDSSALLEKYVDPQSEGKYATYNDGGLTIYTYGTDAAWVNGGILYTVEGTATLSNEQVRRIATSL